MVKSMAIEAQNQYNKQKGHKNKTLIVLTVIYSKQNETKWESKVN